MLNNFVGEGFQVAIDRTDGANRLMVAVESAIKFYKKYGITSVNYAANRAGIYSFATNVPGGEFEFGSFSTPKHLLREKSSGCAWNPVLGMTSTVDSVPMKSLQFHGEQCHDLGEAWELIRAAGNENRNLLATENGRRVMDMILSQVYDGLDNSFSDLLQDGGHPLIDAADTAGSYSVSAKEWANYKAQQSAFGGFTTMLDSFADQGAPGFNVQIPESLFDGESWVGDVREFFKSLKKAASRDQITTIKSMKAKGQGRGVYAVDEITFQAYKDRLIAENGGIPDTYRLMTTGTDGVSTMALQGVLEYDGDWVVEMGEWGNLGLMTNNTIIRGCYLTPGVLGIALDVGRIPQADGIGLLVENRFDLPNIGKTFMFSTYKLGNAIIDTKQITHGSVVYAN